jgi:hypothetical protein
MDWGTAWAESRRSLIAEVPSVVVPAEHNVLINPRHADAARLRPQNIIDRGKLLMSGADTAWLSEFRHICRQKPRPAAASPNANVVCRGLCADYPRNSTHQNDGLIVFRDFRVSSETAQKPRQTLPDVLAHNMASVRISPLTSRATSGVMPPVPGPKTAMRSTRKMPRELPTQNA